MSDINQPEPYEPAEPQGFLLPSKAYDILKPVTTTIMPGVATLYSALAALYAWDNSAVVVGTIVAVNTFLGLFLGLSSRSYNHSDARFDGELAVIDGPDKTIVRASGLEPDDLLGKNEVVFKVTNVS